MGWMQRAYQARAISNRKGPCSDSLLQVKETCESVSTQHIDDPEDPSSFKPVSCSLADADLPFIPHHVVVKSSESGLLWIVIDNVIYDCGEFVHEHPGGPDVMQPFWGSDCSWQFRRFHPGGTLQEHGKALRLGRTLGVANKFEERPRFVGLRRSGCYD